MSSLKVIWVFSPPACAVGLHAGHDLSRPPTPKPLQAERQGTRSPRSRYDNVPPSPSRSAAPSSTITARNCPAPSWSIPTIITSIWSGRRQGDPLWHHRRRRSHRLVRHRQGRQHDRMADMASDPGRDSQAHRRPARPRCPAGPDNPLALRALYLYSGGKDTLFRIHGTNQPEYIGASISSGCIRMTNEDVIDLYSRVKHGTVVVVLEPQTGRLAVQFQDGAAGRRPDGPTPQ